MYELNDVVRKLGESVIEEHEELRHLNDPSSPCRIAYLYSDGKKCTAEEWYSPMPRR